MPSWLLWMVSPSGGLVLGAFSFWLGVLGFAGTIFGIRLTYIQARQARNAADAAQEAVEGFRVRIESYTAYRDLAEAGFAIDETRRHLQNYAWRHASDSYEAAMRALVRVIQSSVSFDSSVKVGMEQITQQITAFCNRVDAALAGKGTLPDQSKVLSAIRSNYSALSAARAELEKRVE